MTTYTITEKQNLESTRLGYEFSGSLRAAKAEATRNRVYKGTILTIEKGGELVAYRQGRNWTDC